MSLDPYLTRNRWMKLQIYRRHTRSRQVKMVFPGVLVSRTDCGQYIWYQRPLSYCLSRCSLRSCRPQRVGQVQGGAPKGCGALHRYSDRTVQAQSTKRNVEATQNKVCSRRKVHVCEARPPRLRVPTTVSCGDGVPWNGRSSNGAAAWASAGFPSPSMYLSGANYIQPRRGALPVGYMYWLC